MKKGRLSSALLLRRQGIRPGDRSPESTLGRARRERQSTQAVLRRFVFWTARLADSTFCSAISVVLYPLYESRAALALIARGIIKVSLVSVCTASVVLSTGCRISSPRVAESSRNMSRK